MIAGVLFIGALAGGGLWLRSTQVELEPVSNCPVDGPTAVHLIVIDRSDPMSAQQGQRVRQEIESLEAEAEFGNRFDFYTIEGEGGAVLTPILQICSPLRPENANILIQNPPQLKKAFEENFAAAVDETLDDLLTQTTRPTSPILESLRAAAITSFGPIRKNIPLTVIVASDMIQHSEALSQYRSEVDFESLENSNVWPPLRPDFKGAQVRILYVLRPGAATSQSNAIQNRGHQAFWEHAIRSSGGQVTNIDPI